MIVWLLRWLYCWSLIVDGLVGVVCLSYYKTTFQIATAKAIARARIRRIYARSNDPTPS